MSKEDILVVGGYGVVGRRIAALLAARFPDRVVVAGRDAAQATQVSGELGHGARPRRIDVDDRESVETALAGVGTVMACVAQREPHLLRSAIAHGMAYTDLAPRLAFWRGVEGLDGEAKRTGARVVLGAGLSPGVSNMMVRQLADRLGRVDRIETSIALSLGDEYGPDSLRHVFESLTRRFEVLMDGRLRSAVPYSEGQRVAFPPPVGPRRAYLFPWSDVVYYPRTLGAHTSVGRFALEPIGVSYFLSSLMRLGAGRWLEHPSLMRVRRAAMGRVKQLGSGGDAFALVTTVVGNGRALSMSLGGRHQADVTAAAAFEFARGLAAGEVVNAGVWLPEEVIAPESFFTALATRGFRPELAELRASST